MNNTKIFTRSNGCYYTDLNYLESTLRRVRGSYYLTVEGGARTVCAKTLSDGWHGYGKVRVYLTDKEAQEVIEDGYPLTQAIEDKIRYWKDCTRL